MVFIPHTIFFSWTFHEMSVVFHDISYKITFYKPFEILRTTSPRIPNKLWPEILLKILPRILMRTRPWMRKEIPPDISFGFFPRISTAILTGHTIATPLPRCFSKVFYLIWRWSHLEQKIIVMKLNVIFQEIFREQIFKSSRDLTCNNRSKGQKIENGMLGVKCFLLRKKRYSTFCTFIIALQPFVLRPYVHKPCF